MSPGPHDIIEVTALPHGGCAVACSCGRKFVAESPDRARARHAGHYGVEKAKAALEQGRGS